MTRLAIAVRPTQLHHVERAYLAGTLVLRTTMHAATGTLQLTDALALAEGSRNHDIGAASPHVLLRHAVCTHGHVEVDAAFAPRFETAATGASSGPAIVWQLLARALWKELTESYTMAVHISGPDPHIHHVLGRLLWH